MGYHDLEPEAFIFSVAVQQTNSAEEALLFQEWMDKMSEKTKSLTSAHDARLRPIKAHK